MIDNHKTQVKWEIQLTMAINFISFKDSDETHSMHTKLITYVEIMIGNETDEIIEELLNYLLQRYQKNLEKSWKEKNLFLIVLIYCTKNFIK